ncbi:MAG: hypothetical protein H8E66_14670 [Planctomycetes bacterium]|nr:hypothetical protein [Planctomycetota bacterium]
MANARLIVTDTSGRWAFALRTAFANAEVSLTEVDGLANAFEMFRDDSDAVLAFEATDACAEEAFGHLKSVRRTNPGRNVIVLLDGSITTPEWLWQEAGAIAVVTSPRHLVPVARMIRRYFDTRESPPLAIREAVWQRMPWSGSKSQT